MLVNNLDASLEAFIRRDAFCSVHCFSEFCRKCRSNHDGRQINCKWSSTELLASLTINCLKAWAWEELNSYEHAMLDRLQAQQSWSWIEYAVWDRLQVQQSWSWASSTELKLDWMIDCKLNRAEVGLNMQFWIDCKLNRAEVGQAQQSWSWIESLAHTC